MTEIQFLVLLFLENEGKEDKCNTALQGLLIMKPDVNNDI